MALEHRQMHLETLAYMFHNFSYELKRMPVSGKIQPHSGFAVENAWRDVPAGEAVLGRPHNGSFGWDNEYEEVRQPVPAFRIQQYKISNGDYLRFVKEGAPLPPFWVQRGGALFYRGMFEEIPLPLDWPVYVTQLEAADYAKWLGKELPTEEQFHRAAYATAPGENSLYPWGDAEPTHKRGNFDFKRWDPEAVNATPAGNSAWGVSQLVGNGWEWPSTVFGPCPRFKARET